ncbi:glycosyltransferase [Hymenobacter lucidus]|uniref:Glycosyltransferase n=1 Tax=Hymenobacter lucidus TaxID=2880930 RepID=A0ABS8AW94_9BACT|nr:glycosyltransferase [Hymenobacter lucidus]MCB2410042.1 glycosyltransferase [Hymenobacter lucidus]
MPHPSSSTVVLLASVLKPVDDTRMFGKFAPTLAARPHTTVHVAGRGPGSASAAAAPSGIQQHVLFSGSRLSWSRLRAQWSYWQLLRRLRPDVVFVHAPELLPLTLLWHGLDRQRQFVYDIRENYALNVTTQRVYGGLTRRALAAGLRWIETLAARRAAGVVLAERSYAEELPFLRALPAGSVVVLENKYQPAPAEALLSHSRTLPARHEPLELLYSGTISELNGVFEAITFTQTLRQHWPLARLTIIGFCQRPDQLQRLTQVVAASHGAAMLIGGATLVPHAQIRAQIQRSHLGLLPYRPHPSTWRCVPTKLFEYLANGLPLLIPANDYWRRLVQQHGAGLVVGFDETFDAAAFVEVLTASSFYLQGIPPEAFWHTEATKLRALLDTIR